MEAYEAIMTRRSTRKFKAEPVGPDKLEKVLEAGRAAPCGGNNQSVHFIVIRNQRVLEELAEVARQAFAAEEITPATYKSRATAIRLSQKGTFVFHYHAPVLVVTANKKGYGNAMADCACALENMMVAANALDLGTCWINQLHWLDEQPAVRAYMKQLGLSDDEAICASLAIGAPDTADGLPIRLPRKITGNPVDYVD